MSKNTGSVNRKKDPVCARSHTGIIRLAAIFFGFFASTLAADEPMIRAGLLSDTHVTRMAESCSKTKLAFELFRKNGVDMVIHLGDLAESHNVEAYRLYRKTFEEVFGNDPPREIIVYAYHDMTRDSRRNVDWEPAMAEFKHDLQIRNHPYDQVIVKGFPFLVYPQCADMKRMEREIREMTKKHPGKPIFVLDHIPPYDTVDNSRVRPVQEKRLERREILDRYPQVVHLSGHIHNSVRNERCIWQGKFTAVNVPTLQRWAGRPVNNDSVSRKPCDEAMIMEVYPDKILFRRFCVTDGSEIRPWCVPLPFDPGKAPYAPEYRRLHSAAPEFPDGSRIKAVPTGKPFREMAFSFPEADRLEDCYLYHAELAKKNASGHYETVGIKEDFGGFYLKRKREEVRIGFNAGYFDAEGKYRITVTPLGFHGNPGKPLTLDLAAGEPEQGKIRYESFQPMKECPYRTGFTGGERLEEHDGFYNYPQGYTRLIFPEKVWDAPAGTRFRFIIELSTEQPESSSLTVGLRAPDAIRYVKGRLVTPSGKRSHYRMVFEFIRKNDPGQYALVLGDGLPGKVAFHYVRIEQL